MLDENEFLSPHGLRSVSKFHEKNPCVFQAGGVEHCVNYEPAESNSHLFGGNSNWRGPVWFPINFLIIESLDATTTSMATPCKWSAQPARVT